MWYRLNSLVAYVVLAVLATMFSVKTFAEVREPVAAEFADQLRVVRVLDDISTAVQVGDWTNARKYFAETVTVDFSAVIGGEPVTMSADDFISSWCASAGREVISGIAYGNHQVLVNGNEATVLTKGDARGFLPVKGDQKISQRMGSFRHTLERTARGWKVVHVQFISL